MANSTQERRCEIVCALLATAGWATLWWPLLFAGERLHVRDLSRFALPSKQFLFDELAAGRWPLWTPWLGAGQPWLADLAHQAFYPGNLAYLLPAAFGVEAHAALDVFVLAHSLLALLGMRVLLAMLGVERVAAWSLALVYAASGVAVSLTDNITYLPAAGWLPLALAALADATIRARAVAAAALATSMLLLAGDVLDLGLLLLFAPLLMCVGSPSLRCGLRVAGVFAVVLLLVFLLAAAQLLPTLDLLAQGDRVAGLSLADAQVWSLPPQRLLELFAPFVFGAKYPLREVLLPALYPQAQTPWFESLYLGLVPVSLALVAVLTRQPRALRWTLVLLLVLLLALGRHTPLYGWAHAWAPLLDTQRYPEKLALWLTLCLVVLAGLGARPAQALLQRLRAAEPRRDLLLRVAASVALPMGMLMLLAELPAGLLPADALATPSAYWHTRLGFAASWLQGALLHALVLALALVAAVWVARRHARAAFVLLLLTAALDLLWLHAAHAPGMPALLLADAPAPAVLARMPSLTGKRLHLDPTAPDYAQAPAGDADRRVAALYRDESQAMLAGAQWMRSTLLERERLAADGNVLLGVALLDTGLAPLAPTLQAQRLTDAQSGDVALLAASAVSYVIAPAARAGHWRAAGLHEIDADPSSDLLLFEVPAAQAWASLGDDGFVRTMQRSPGRLLMETRSGAGARLVVRESWHPGWQLWLDGQPAGAPGVDDAGMLALEVPAGEHRIEFVFHERTLPAGLLLSLAGVLTTCWLLLGAPRPRRIRRGL